MEQGKNVPAFLMQPGAVNPMGGDTKQGPVQDPSYTQGGAPGGQYPNEQELPVEATSGGMRPATTTGYVPTPSQAPLPEPGSSTGFPVYKPGGNQR